MNERSIPCQLVASLPELFVRKCQLEKRNRGQLKNYLKP